MVLRYEGGRQDRQAERYNVAYTVLVGIILLAVLPFTLLSLARCKSRRDPARRFVPWFKASFVLFCITLCLLLAQFIIATCAVYGVDTGRESIRAAFHLGYLAELFRTLSAATVMVLLFMLGPGIRHAIHGVPGSLDGVIRYSAYLLGFAVMALAITYYGLLVDYYVNFTNLTGAVTSGWAYPRLKTVNDLISAASIILFAASLVITGLSIATFARSTISPLKSSAVLYLLASLLNLLGSTWNFAYAVGWLLMDRPMEDYVLILTMILTWWSRGLLLIIAYFIAVRSGARGGVWSGVWRGSSMHESANRDSYNTASAFI